MSQNIFRHRQKKTTIYGSLVGERRERKLVTDPWIVKNRYLATDPFATYEQAYGHYYASSIDELHPPPYDTGGPLDLYKRYFGGLQKKGGAVEKEVFVPHTYRPKYVSYKGSFISSLWPNSAQFGDYVNHNIPTWESLFPFGGTRDTTVRSDSADSLFRIKPGVNLGQTIGEIADIPRMIRHRALSFYRSYRRLLRRSSPVRRRKFIRNISKTWLEANFGWFPFVKDVQDMYHTWHHHSETLRELRKWNDKDRKRRKILTNVTSTTDLGGSDSTPMHYPYVIPNITGGVPYGSYNLTLFEYEKMWVEGRFRYYIPRIDSVQWQRKAVRYLFGLNVTPTLLWELTPYSWLIDWYTNVGKMIQEAGGTPDLQENLVAKYAHTMTRKKKIILCKSVLNFNDGTRHDATWYYHMTRKLRHDGVNQPFWKSGDLSARQYSILAALGISKLLK